jgi:hypothetical protein
MWNFFGWKAAVVTALARTRVSLVLCRVATSTPLETKHLQCRVIGDVKATALSPDRDSADILITEFAA